MKRIFALTLCLALAVSLAMPCLAEGEEPLPEAVVCGVESAEPLAGQTMDEGLAELTLKVKQALDIGDSYTAFSSDYYDGPSPVWSLRWSDEQGEISVEARPDGTVLDMYRWENGGRNERFYGFDAAFPPLAPDEARAQAESWCEKLFTGEETGRIDGVRINLGVDGSYRFAGTVLKNGLESPITFTMIVDGTGLASFYRDDMSGFVGDTPAAEAGAEKDAAAQALAGAVKLELRWVSDGEGGAKLLYMPVGARTVADAQTGEAVDMDALYASFQDGTKGMAYDAAAPAAEASMNTAEGGAALTEIEQSSIANYGDVLDGPAIDQVLAGIELLGLEGFEQTRCSYAMDSETGDVTASVRYAGTMTGEQLYGYSADAFEKAVEAGQDMTIYKYITLNAKTGELVSLATSYPIWEKEEKLLGLVNQAGFARQFIDQVLPDLAPEAELCTLKGYDEREDMVFAQMRDGYFFPDNRITVHAAPTSGVIDQFRYDWDEDVTFAPAEEIVDADQALAAYTDALDVILGYVAWPVDITKEEALPYSVYRDWGYTYVEQLRLAYYYSGLDRVKGVDAVTGEAVLPEETDGTYVYDDLDDEPLAAEIVTLGDAGVGFSGGSFLPEQELTVRDAALLLLRAGGMYAPEEDDERLGEQAAYQGFLPDGTWEPDKTVSRMAFLRMLLTPSRYGYAAALTGVWDAGFADVDEAGEAIAAIARALGLAEGDTLEPDETLTRAAAADILYRFMSR